MTEFKDGAEEAAQLLAFWRRKKGSHRETPLYMSRTWERGPYISRREREDWL
jgi:hypothetical protein